MTPERWHRIEELCQAALDLSPADRPEFLTRACRDDKKLQGEIEGLIASYERAGRFLERPQRSAALRVLAAQLKSESAVHVTVTTGTKLGDYEVVSLLGSGGMGEVYRASDTRLRRDVAIKVLPATLSHDPDRLRRFEQEARAAAALNHANILAVFQLGNYEGAPYLVSELLEGITLREQLSRGPVALRKTIDYGVQIARGLTAAHEKGIVHRDLKPENLFLTKDGRIKILDFGLAKLKPTQHENSASTLSETAPGVVMGTVGYMSPEQIRGDTADHRTDIFALGAVLYEMLTGKRAFQKPTSAETMAAILNEESTAISELSSSTPPSLQRIVHRCLEKNPEQRFQSASDLAFALEALSDSGTVASIPTAQKSFISIRTWIGAGLLAAIAVVAVWWEQPIASPHIENIRQLTHDNLPKKLLPSLLASDGSRLYFTEQRGGAFEVAQVSVAGGDTVPLASDLANPSVLDIAPDSSALLVSYGSEDDTYIGILPLPGGQLRSITHGYTGAFFPDGKKLVYCRDASMYVAQADGSNPRKISGRGCDPVFNFPPSISPDGSRIRFAVTPAPFSYWEVDADGNNPRPLSPQFAGMGGKWTSDARYFVFEQAGRIWRNDLWWRVEQRALYSGSKLPVSLTNGPLSFDAPLPSRDGKSIYSIGFQNRGELVRYDSSTRQFLPILDGISATDLAYSADGKWVVYLSYPTHELWRSRADGSDRLQLTYAPMAAFWPHLSPDATQVQFLGMTPEADGRESAGQYIVSMRGGESKKVIDANPFGSAGWSLDGRALLILVPRGGEKNDDLDAQQLASLDISSGKTAIIPGSEGKGGAFQLSPDTIIAGGPHDNLYWFDMRAQKWFVLVDGPILNWMPSPDSKYLYFVRESPKSPEIMRVRMSDRKVEPIVSVQGIRRVADPAIGGSSWLGVAPDGSALLTRDTGTQEIYALTVKWP